MKKIIFAISTILCANVLTAQTPLQPPMPSTNPTNEANPAGTTLRSTAPVVPATLLLLGLGGATVGTIVYRNSKKKEE